MIKKIQILTLIVILVFLFLGCNKNNISHSNSSTIEEPQIKAQQKSVSIRKMSDLEVIKKCADYLKSCGKKLTFEETKIIYENNQSPSSICKNKDNEDVYYSGEYLVVSFYPHSHMEHQDSIIKVFIGEDGRVLGHVEE